MAEEQLVVFKLGLEEYAVPIFEVREIIKYGGATKIPEAPAYMEGIIKLREKVVPVINLSARFGQEYGQAAEPKVIIIEKDKQIIEIIVNEVTEVLRLTEDEIEAPPAMTAENKFITGIGKIKDRLLILLSLKELFSDYEVDELKRVS